MISLWSRRAVFSPANLSNLAAWFRYGQGITETGAGVSQWDDASGNTRHLKQGTDTNRPAKQGDGSILFDGADNFLKCDAFTLNQPFTVYLLAKQVTWTSGDYLFDGNTTNSALLRQRTSSPRLGLFAGTVADVADTTWTLDTYMPVAVVFDGASSVLQINNGVSNTVNPGAQNAAGFTLGSAPAATNPANIQVKEVVIYAAAHDASTRAQVNAYLATL